MSGFAFFFSFVTLIPLFFSLFLFVPDGVRVTSIKDIA
jgi:hypothetical protein